MSNVLNTTFRLDDIKDDDGNSVCSSGASVVSDCGFLDDYLNDEPLTFDLSNLEVEETAEKAETPAKTKEASQTKVESVEVRRESKDLSKYRLSGISGAVRVHMVEIKNDFPGQIPLKGKVFTLGPSKVRFPGEGLVCKYGLEYEDYGDIMFPFAHGLKDRYGFTIIPNCFSSNNNDAENTKCCLCRATFNARWELERHMIKHVKKTHECAICGVVYSSRTFLKKHVELAHGKFRNICSICEKIYTRQSFLADHVRVAHDDVRNKCRICAQVVPDIGHLDAHIKKFHSDIDYFL